MKIYLAPVEFSITSCTGLSLELFSCSLYTQPLTEITATIIASYSASLTGIETGGFKRVFAGVSTGLTLMPYNWQVLVNSSGATAILTEFINHPHLTGATAIFDNLKLHVKIHLQAKQLPLPPIDPLFHPLGSLLFVYLASFTNGILIHASGIRDGAKGHLFTAVSGTGKSTMARLWHEAGALVINDDRLWLHKVGDKWQMFNTPMMHYKQTALMTPVNNIFLKRQSPVNEISRVKGATTSTRVS